jgi:hypothetical protein
MRAQGFSIRSRSSLNERVPHNTQRTRPTCGRDIRQAFQFVHDFRNHAQSSADPYVASSVLAAEGTPENNPNVVGDRQTLVVPKKHCITGCVPAPIVPESHSTVNIQGVNNECNQQCNGNGRSEGN